MVSQSLSSHEGRNNEYKVAVTSTKWYGLQYSLNTWCTSMSPLTSKHTYIQDPLLNYRAHYLLFDSSLALVPELSPQHHLIKMSIIISIITVHH